MKIKLSEHFTYHKLLRFVFPSIVMMIFTSIYGVVDGLFVSNYAGKTAFAAINLIMPFIMALSALGFMVGTGGSAIVAKTLGEGKEKEANRYFSMLIYLTIFGGIVLSILGILLARPVSIALGASGDLLDYCTLYGRITFLSLTPFMLQNVFQCFLSRRKNQNLVYSSLFLPVLRIWCWTTCLSPCLAWDLSVPPLQPSVANVSAALYH